MHTGLNLLLCWRCVRVGDCLWKELRLHLRLWLGSPAFQGGSGRTVSFVPHGIALKIISSTPLKCPCSLSSIDLFVSWKVPRASCSSWSLPAAGKGSGVPPESCRVLSHHPQLTPFHFDVCFGFGAAVTTKGREDLSAPVVHPERCWRLLEAPIPCGKSHSLQGSQRDGKFEAAPRQPRSGFVLDFLLSALLSPIPVKLVLSQ